MKKKLVFLSAGCVLASTAIAVSCMVALRGNAFSKLRGAPEDVYSVTILPDSLMEPLAEQSPSAFTSGDVVVETALGNHVDISFEGAYSYVAPNTRHFIAMHDTGFKIYNTTSINYMNSITLATNHDIDLLWGFEVDGSGNPIYARMLKDAYPGTEGHTYTFDDEQPNFFMIRSNSEGHEGAIYPEGITIKMGADCKEGPHASRYKVVNGITYVNENNNRYNVVGFSDSSFEDVTLETVIDGLPVEGIQPNAFTGNSTIKTINLDHITNIGVNAFKGCTNLKSVGSLSNAIIYSYSCFEDCMNLEIETLTFGSNVATIGTNAFNSCSKIQNIVFDDECSVTPSSGAFGWMSGLKTVSIGKKLGYYGEDFYHCPLLEIITVHADNANLYAEDNVLYAKNGEDLTLIRLAPRRSQTSYVMPASVKDVDTYACEQAITLESFTFNDRITTISASLFENCTFLTSVTFGSAIETIDDYAFQNTGLVNITIPSSVKKIDSRAFYVSKKLKTVIVEEGCEDIREIAFEGCTALETVVLPTSLVSVGANGGFGGTDIDVFKGCTSLTHVFTALASGDYTDAVSGWYGSRTLSYYSETELPGCWHYNAGVPELWS